MNKVVFIVFLMVLYQLRSSASSADESAPLPYDDQPRLTLLVPAYFYPSGRGYSDWRRLMEAAREIPIVAIADPDNGPGLKADPLYVETLKKTADSGVTILGYVTTSYAKRPAADVIADIRRWAEMYPGVRGYFLDEQPSAAEHVDYYREIIAAARRFIPDALIISNPGTTCAEGYLTDVGIDVVCLYEGPNDLKAYQPPGSVEQAGRRRVAVLCHSQKSGGGSQAVHQAGQEGYGYAYATDLSGANPWQGLPRDWTQVVATVKRFNVRKSSP
jgi:hypothetical protein